MRKLLLASAATLSVSAGTAGIASAQTQTITTTPPRGVMGMPAQPQPQLGGNNRLNSDGSAPPENMVAPGTVTIHLNGRINWYGYVSGGNGYSVATPAAPGGNPTANGIVGAAGGVNKLQPYGMLGYLRLYPGVDAMATNGLRYGAIAEIRQNFGNAGSAPFQNATFVGSTPTTLNSTSGGASGTSSTNTLYVRRAAVYLGSNTIGIIRMGMDDGPFSQFIGPTTTEGFNDGAWNGDVPAAMPGNVQPTWPFWDQGNEYTVNRITYLSPSFFGFDLGASYAPNSYGWGNANAGCGVAQPGCNALSSSSIAADSGRPKDWYEIALRYRGNFSGVGIYGYGGYSGSGVVNNRSTPTSQNLFNGFSVGTAGLALSYAGFTLAGNAMFGDFNGAVALKPAGGASAVVWIAGLQYATGPFTVGASWYNFQSQGAVIPLGIGTAGTTACRTGCLSQRSENGLAIGATYTPAPGLDIYLSYLYGERHQTGFNFITSSAGAFNNNVHAQAASIGGRVRW